MPAANARPKVLKQGEATVVVFGPEFANLDEKRVEPMRDFLVEVAAGADPPRLVLDLSQTNFFGSGFLEALFRAWTRLKSSPGARLVLCGLSDHCREVIETTNLDRIWGLAPTREEALRMLRGGTD